MDETLTAQRHDGADSPGRAVDASLGATPVVSRRRFLALGAGALGAGGLLAMHRTVSAADSSGLEEPGSALEPARRLSTTTTTTTTTTPADPATPTSLVPLDEGVVRFPIVVDEEASCYVLDNFGDCRGSGCSRSHEGVDIMADRGLPVIAPVAGRLDKRYDDSGLLYGAGNGWTLVDEVNDVVYRFFHLDGHAEGLEVDDEVAEGQVIGWVGNTGTSGASSDTNYHLHFEYRPGNSAVDSYHLLQRAEHVTWEHG